MIIKLNLAVFLTTLMLMGREVSAKGLSQLLGNSIKTSSLVQTRAKSLNSADAEADSNILSQRVGAKAKGKAKKLPKIHTHSSSEEDWEYSESEDGSDWESEGFLHDSPKKCSDSDECSD